MKVTVGKKAADRMKRKKESKDDEEEDLVLDYEGDKEEVNPTEEQKKKKEEQALWTLEGWKVEPRAERNIPGPHLTNPLADLFADDSFIDYLFLFLPCTYIKGVMLPATNKFAKDHKLMYETFTHNEFINFLGLLYMMEVVR